MCSRTAVLSFPAMILPCILPLTGSLWADGVVMMPCRAELQILSLPLIVPTWSEQVAVFPRQSEHQQCCDTKVGFLYSKQVRSGVEELKSCHMLTYTKGREERISVNQDNFYLTFAASLKAGCINQTVATRKPHFFLQKIRGENLGKKKNLKFD